MKLLITIMLGIFSMSAMAQQSNAQLPPVKKDDGTQKTVNNAANSTPQRPPIRTSNAVPASTPRQANNALPANPQANRAPIKTAQSATPVTTNAAAAKPTSQQKPTPSSMSVKQAQEALQKQQLNNKTAQPPVQAAPPTLPRQAPPAKQ